MTKSERNSRVISLLSKFNSPVIVTFDGSGQVVDTFGDPSHYDESPEGLKDLLLSILVGWSERIETLPDVEMPTGRFASIRIVPEGELRHIVLTDVTLAVIEQRDLLQISHEAVLAEHREKVALEKSMRHAKAASVSHGPITDFLIWDVRARLNEILGYAKMADTLSSTCAQGRAISSIKRSAFHLHALSLACASKLREDSILEGRDVELVNIEELLFEIGEQLGPVAHDSRQGEVEVTADKGSSAAWLPYEKVKQVLSCLASCVLDCCGGMARLAADVLRDELILEIRVVPDSGIASPSAVEALLGQLKNDIRFEAAYGLIRDMDGACLAFREDIALGLRVTIPVCSAPADRIPPTADGSVLVAIDDDVLRTRVTKQLAHIDVPSRCCADVDEVEVLVAAGGVALIVLGGRFSGAQGIGAIYRMHGRGIRVRALVIKSRDSGPTAWVFDGRRSLVPTDADDQLLRSAIRGALSA